MSGRRRRGVGYWAGIVALRYLTGQLLSGRDTEGTFWTSGTGGRPGWLSFGTPSWWARWPGWKRAAVRLLPAAWPAAYLLARTATIAVTTLAVTAALAWVAARGWAAWTYRRHTNRYLRPLHLTLCAHLQLPPTLAWTDYVDVPTDFRREGITSTITLPDTYLATAAANAALLELVLGKLGLDHDDVVAQVNAVGRPTVTITPRPAWPDVVDMADHAAEMEALPVGNVLLGRTRSRESYVGSFVMDDPHWGASVGSRRGKSTWLTILIAQVLHQDHRSSASALDVKRVSFAPLVGIPRFRLANNPGRIEEMWGLVAEDVAEMNRRSELIAADPLAAEDFGIRLTVVDEINQFGAQTDSHWQTIRGQKDPKVAPVWDDLAAIAWQGAEMKCHLVVLGQRLDAKATGGKGLRDSFGLRALAGFRPNQWAMLVGTTPIPRSQKPRGRWIYSDGNTTRWVQNLFGTAEQIRAWATSLSPAARAAAGMSQVGPPRQAEGPAGADLGHRRGTPVRVGLAAAAEYLGMETEAFRKARYRAGGELPGETRRGNQPVFTEESLDEFRGTGAVL